MMHIPLEFPCNRSSLAADSTANAIQNNIEFVLYIPGMRFNVKFFE